MAPWRPLKAVAPDSGPSAILWPGIEHAGPFFSETVLLRRALVLDGRLPPMLLGAPEARAGMPRAPVGLSDANAERITAS